MSDLLQRMGEIDRAWNMRDWDAYANILDDAIHSYSSGDSEPHGKREHVARAQGFCATFPDSRVEMTPYLELFSSVDATRTCSIARLTGTMTGDWKAPSGDVLLAGNGRRFDVTFATICSWRAGRIISQFEYADRELLLRQLRGESPANHPMKG